MENNNKHVIDQFIRNVAKAGKGGMIYIPAKYIGHTAIVNILPKDKNAVVQERILNKLRKRDKDQSICGIREIRYSKSQELTEIKYFKEGSAQGFSAIAEYNGIRITNEDLEQLEREGVKVKRI